MDVEGRELGATPHANACDGPLQEAPAYSSRQSVDLFQEVLNDSVHANSNMLRTHLDYSYDPTYKPRKAQASNGWEVSTSTYNVLRSENSGQAIPSEQQGIYPDSQVYPNQVQGYPESSGTKPYQSTSYISCNSAVDLRQDTLDEALSQRDGDKSEVAPLWPSKYLTCSI